MKNDNYVVIKFQFLQLMNESEESFCWILLQSLRFIKENIRLNIYIAKLEKGKDFRTFF